MSEGDNKKAKNALLEYFTAQDTVTTYTKTPVPKSWRCKLPYTSLQITVEDKVTAVSIVNDTIRVLTKAKCKIGRIFASELVSAYGAYVYEVKEQ